MISLCEIFAATIGRLELSGKEIVDEFWFIKSLEAAARAINHTDLSGMVKAQAMLERAYGEA